MSTPLFTVRPHPDVVDTEIEEGETALLHLGTRTYFSLNVTGTRIWQGLKRGLTVSEMSARLAQEFDVDGAHAEECVNGLVEQLVRHELARRA